jgi:hypothetical protein
MRTSSSELKFCRRRTVPHLRIRAAAAHVRVDRAGAGAAAHLDVDEPREAAASPRSGSEPVGRRRRRSPAADAAPEAPRAAPAEQKIALDARRLEALLSQDRVNLAAFDVRSFELCVTAFAAEIDALAGGPAPPTPAEREAEAARRAFRESFAAADIEIPNVCGLDRLHLFDLGIVKVRACVRARRRPTVAAPRPARSALTRPMELVAVYSQHILRRYINGRVKMNVATRTLFAVVWDGVFQARHRTRVSAVELLNYLGSMTGRCGPAFNGLPPACLPVCLHAHLCARMSTARSGSRMRQVIEFLPSVMCQLGAHTFPDSEFRLVAHTAHVSAGTGAPAFASARPCLGAAHAVLAVA